MGGNRFAKADAIEASLMLAGERVPDPTELVYARLFAEHPHMEGLFCHDRNNAVKGEMLSRALDNILDYIGERHYADHLIRSECMTHDMYGVPPEVFSTFFATLAATLQGILGADWTAETDAAWRELLAELAALTKGVAAAT